MNSAIKLTSTSATLLLLFVFAGCSTTGGSTASGGKVPAEDPGSLTSADVYKDPNRMICRRERPTGSRISEKVCMTARQWFEANEATRRSLDKAQRSAKGADSTG